MNNKESALTAYIRATTNGGTTYLKEIDTNGDDLYYNEGTVFRNKCDYGFVLLAHRYAGLTVKAYWELDNKAEEMMERIINAWDEDWISIYPRGYWQRLPTIHYEIKDNKIYRVINHFNSELIGNAVNPDTQDLFIDVIKKLTKNSKSMGLDNLYKEEIEILKSFLPLGQLEILGMEGY
jgi:hypothetical protein